MVFRWRGDFGVRARKALQPTTAALAGGAANELLALVHFRTESQSPEQLADYVMATLSALAKVR
jgi:hypothetical protein